MKTLKATVSGRVQGVGFRYFVRMHAEELKLKGNAINLPDGRVEIILQGEESTIQIMLAHIRKGPRFSHVESLDCEELVNAAIQSGFTTG